MRPLAICFVSLLKMVVFCLERKCEKSCKSDNFYYICKDFVRMYARVQENYRYKNI